MMRILPPWMRRHPAISLILLAISAIVLTGFLLAWKYKAYLDSTLPSVACICWHPDSRHVISAHKDGSIRITDTLQPGVSSSQRIVVPAPKGRWFEPEEVIGQMRCHPNGKRLLGIGYKFLHVWNLDTGKEVFTRHGIVYRDMQVSWKESTNEIFICNVLQDRIEIKIWNIENVTKEEAVHLKTPDDTFNYTSFAFSKLGTTLLTRGVKKNRPDPNPYVYEFRDTQTGNLKETFSAPYSLRSFSLNPDRTRVAMAVQGSVKGGSSRIIIKNLQTHTDQLLIPLPASSAHPLSYPLSMDIKWSMDGKHIGLTYRKVDPPNVPRIVFAWWDAASGHLTGTTDICISFPPYYSSLKTGPSSELSLFRSDITGIEWSPDLRSIVIGFHHTSFFSSLYNIRTAPTKAYILHYGYGTFGSLQIVRAPGGAVDGTPPAEPPLSPSSP